MMDTLPETNNAYESTSKPAVGLSVGATLRAAREEQGLKIEDVADRVKFSVRQVEALEADDILHLPQGTFLRGFIRSYARVLHLDETALLEAMQGKTESHLEVTDSQSGGEAFPILDFTRRKNLYLLVGALVVAIVLVVFVWSHRDTPKHEKVVVEDVSLPKVSAVSAPVIALPDVASAVQSTVAPVIPVAPIISVNPKITPTSLPPVAKTTSVNAPVLVKTPVAPIIPVAPVVSVESKKAPTSLPPLAKTASVKALVAPVVSVEPKKKPASLLPKVTETASVKVPVAAPLVSDKPEIPLEQLKKRPIHIVFIDEVWMEIIDANGEVLLSRTTQAGDEKWIGGGNRAPYHLTIGKAGAVRVYYKQHEVDLSQYNKAGLVKLILE